jgi:hypothetical protein
MDIQQGHIIPDTLPIKEKEIRWFWDLLICKNRVYNMKGFDNKIMMAYGMCPTPLHTDGILPNRAGLSNTHALHERNSGRSMGR